VGDRVTPQIRVERIKRRADFLRAQKFRRQFTPGLTLEACPSPGDAAGPRQCRLGVTASRKVGSAVKRNRAKRRLRAAAAALLPLLGREGHDYVLIAKGATLTRPYAALIADLTKALMAAHTGLEAAPAGRPKGGSGGSEARNDPHT
jgi:ribonuclease P protein component